MLHSPFGASAVTGSWSRSWANDRVRVCADHCVYIKVESDNGLSELAEPICFRDGGPFMQGAVLVSAMQYLVAFRLISTSSLISLIADPSHFIG